MSKALLQGWDTDELMRAGENAAEMIRRPKNSTPTLPEEPGIDLSPITLDPATVLAGLASRVPEIISQLSRLVDRQGSPEAARHVLLTTMRSLGFALEDLATASGQPVDAGRVSAMNAILYSILNEGIMNNDDE